MCFDPSGMLGEHEVVVQVGDGEIADASMEGQVRYMIVETFTHGPAPVYARFRERGRMAPEGLVYESSVVAEDGSRCWQLMSCDDPALLERWMAAWRDLVHFEVVPVIASAEAAARFGPGSEAEGG